MAWQQHRAALRVPPGAGPVAVPQPAAARAARPAGTSRRPAVARAFKVWVAQIGVIDSELPGPDGTPAPFDPSLITPYALRHSYAQRHADAGVPVDVLKELMDHVVGDHHDGLLPGRPQTQAAGHPLGRRAGHRRRGQPGAVHQPHRLRAGLGVGAVRQLHRTVQRQSRRRRLPDPLPVRRLRLLPARPVLPARPRSSTSPACAPTGKPPWRSAPPTTSLASLTAEIDAFTDVAEQMRHRLSELAPAERAEVEQASKLLRRARAARHSADRITPAPGHGMTAATPHRTRCAPPAPTTAPTNASRVRPPSQPSKPPGHRSPRPPSPPPPGCPPGSSTPTASASTSRPPAAARPTASPAPGPAAPPGRGEPVTPASLRTDLAVARDEIRRLRAEHGQTPRPAPPPARRRDRRTRPGRADRPGRRPRNRHPPARRRT